MYPVGGLEVAGWSVHSAPAPQLGGAFRHSLRSVHGSPGLFKNVPPEHSPGSTHSERKGGEGVGVRGGKFTFGYFSVCFFLN